MLHFRDTNLHNDSLDSVLLGISRLKKLQELTLQFQKCKFNDLFADNFEEAIEGIKGNLQNLDICFSFNEIGFTGIAKVAKSLKKLCKL